MIGLSEEYEKMFRLEGQLWWYRILHERVETAVKQQFGERRDIQLLDAGCGTGGLLDFLRKHDYSHLKGIDGSTDGVAFCRARGLSVTLLNLTDLADYEPAVRYDVIVCNDVFCYFTDNELSTLLHELARRLKPGGILISNNNAFAVFRGQHDLAVGSGRRFVRADFEQRMPRAGLTINTATYWSFVLSPLILAMRQWQDWQLRLGWRKPEHAQSDVYLPSSWLNETLYTLVRIEEKVLPRTPFGSSLFIVSKPTATH
ncbi:class I SAM-dependent DNA methyltransferase [Spirosoma agri]|uniref:Class I SAM-dependent methyltransferase n=1 Tax=Spirosoma agri TaxID=1987381 RepID=A0A6M0IEF5_9BACT|nr:class I SAM-dependent methyltransferase [Spirosoma agri]NEU66528.1 class I SAM-dependent methyltransferase [Spirosoma agri]